jgi:predicted AAA+ superfamily ATPase
MDHSAVIGNIVALALLKWCELETESKGRNLNLQCYRDSNNREVDFVITEGRKVLACIEVKTIDDSLSPSLHYLSQRVNPKYSFQLVHKIDREKDYGSVKVRALARWLQNITTELS